MRPCMAPKPRAQAATPSSTACSCSSSLTAASRPMTRFTSLAHHGNCITLTAAVVVSGRYRLSRREVRQLLQDLWEVKLSLGAVVRQEQAQSTALASIVEEARAAVQQAAVVNMDETGWRQEQRRAWLWTVVTAKLTVFRIDRSR